MILNIVRVADFPFEAPIIIAIVGFLLWVITSIVEKIQEIFFPEKCSHGVQISNPCSKCKEENDEANRKAQNAKILAEFRIKSIENRMAEAIRIHQLSLKKIEGFLELDGYQFEDAMAKLYNQRGFKVTQTPKSNDGGFDLIGFKNDTKYFVECKCYKLDTKIGRPAIQKLYAAMMHVDGYIIGHFITTSDFSKQAIEFAKNKDMVLINGELLVKIYNEAYPGEYDINQINLKCEICGDTQPFHRKNDSYKNCINGHRIGNDFEGYYKRLIIEGVKNFELQISQMERRMKQ